MGHTPMRVKGGGFVYEGNDPNSVGGARGTMRGSGDWAQQRKCQLLFPGQHRAFLESERRAGKVCARSGNRVSLRQLCRKRDGVTSPSLLLPSDLLPQSSLGEPNQRPEFVRAHCLGPDMSARWDRERGAELEGQVKFFKHLTIKRIQGACEQKRKIKCTFKIKQIHHRINER